MNSSERMEALLKLVVLQGQRSEFLIGMMINSLTLDGSEASTMIQSFVRESVANGKEQVLMTLQRVNAAAQEERAEAKREQSDEDKKFEELLLASMKAKA